jgi:hypothetical protein
MSDADWLSRRSPAPPEELAAAVRDALKARNISGDPPSPTQLLETAQSLLENVLKTECATRESALALLTADALVTYALEVANDAGQLGGFPEQAMKTLASTENTGDSARK